jgi:predicted permease
VSRLPISTNPNVSARGGNPFSIEGQSWHPASPIDGSVPQTAHNQVADPGYFRALQIPLLDGRFFTKSDVQNAPPVVIVNEKLARAFFPRGAIGRRILLGAPQPGAPWLTIVGVVGDVRMTALAHDIMPQFYTPQAQDANASMTIVVRTNSDPLRTAREAAAVVRSIDAEVPVYDVNTMEQRIARSVSQPRFETTILAFFAAAALFLAAIGIFGVVAHSAARRTQEIGIRMALGADRARVLRHVVADGLRPVALGAVAGVISAAALGHVLSSVLFHVTPQDPQIFIVAVTTLGIVAIAASFLPARRATRIDPMNALRSE